MGDQRLADEIAFRALSHLQVLTYGTNAGASTLGASASAASRRNRTRRRTRTTNGTEPRRGVGRGAHDALRGGRRAPLPQPNHPIVFPVGHRQRRAAGSVAGKTRPAARGLADGRERLDRHRARQLAEGLLARTLAAVRLLRRESRQPARPDARAGPARAMLLEQAIAIEETVVASLFFDGAVLGA
jgi:hypothetical protein